jgi:hypothetical protein
LTGYAVSSGGCCVNICILVEKVEDNDGSKSSRSGRNKRPVIKKVMEYCYEPEMEEVTATCIVLCIFNFFRLNCSLGPSIFPIL